ncbi:MAG: hypothetical protein COA73_10815 [Candidatus Hydrogenedentota bacterium]|nr:MAG: hypothetical protein COA73_10815 [Candidatus Hydrogenedentota bacterium]
MPPKRKQIRNSIRRHNKKLPSDLILIVCEDAVSAPAYFYAIVSQRKPTFLEIRGEECGSDPRSVVRYAVELIRKRKKEPKYDQVWCVIDRDQHPDKVLNDARQLAKSKNIKLVISVPCFEIWYLLHFSYSAKPYTDFRSLNQDLKSIDGFENYSKSDPPIEVLLPETDTAIKNSKRLRASNEKSGSENPATDLDKVVESLQERIRENDDDS